MTTTTTPPPFRTSRCEILWPGHSKHPMKSTFPRRIVHMSHRKIQWGSFLGLGILSEYVCEPSAAFRVAVLRCTPLLGAISSLQQRWKQFTERSTITLLFFENHGGGGAEVHLQKRENVFYLHRAYFFCWWLSHGAKHIHYRHCVTFVLFG
jgi:hypothetical protein